MNGRGPLALLLVLLLSIAGSADVRAEAPRQAENPDCVLDPRLAVVQEAMPDLVGDCLSEPWHDPASGDVAQLTSRGALTWRQADAMLLFTDGLSLWLAGHEPGGPSSRSEALASLGAAAEAAPGPAAGQPVDPAAELRVDSTADAPDATPGDGICATTAGACTVRAAIMEANATPGPRRVTVPAGVYKLGIEGPGEDRAATGDLDITDDLELVGAGPGETYLQGAGLDRVLDVHSRARVTVRGLRVRRGTVWADGGAGIRNAGLLTLVDANVSSNKAFDGRGGGLLTAPGSATALVRTSVWHNKATAEPGGDGGGIYNQGVLWLLNANLANNQAEGGAGGGLHNRGLAIVTSSTLTTNAAVAGGSIGNALGLVQLKNSIIADSQQGDDCSGAVYSRGHNLVQHPGACKIVGDTTGNLLGSDPLMGALVEDGPRAGSRDLRATSPVIDAGTNDGCPVDDLRGMPRPRHVRGTGDPTCDIGAIEYQPE